MGVGYRTVDKADCGRGDRNNLVLDLDDSSIQVGEWSIGFDSDTADDVLRQYLELVRRIRHAPQAAELVLRGDDITTIAEGLGEPAADIAARLQAFLGSVREPERALWLARIGRLAGVGLAVAVALGATTPRWDSGEASPVAQAPNATTDMVELSLVDLSAGSNRNGSGGTVVVGTPAGGAGLAGGIIGGGGEPVERSGELTMTPVSRRTPSESAHGGVDGGVDTTMEPTMPDPTVISPSDGEVAAADEVGTALVIESPSARLDAIQAAIPFEPAVALPGWTVEYAGSHPNWRGITNSVTHTIVLYERPGSTVGESAEILAHEYGHAIDLTYLDTDDRRAWLALRNMPEVWWTTEGASDFAVGAGDFAEAVAALLVGSPSHSDHGPFTAEQLAFVDRVLARMPAASAQV